SPPTRLVGRVDELTEIEHLLAGRARLVSVVGPGGAGKTRLALEAAWNTLGLFGGGTWFADASPATDAPRLLRLIQAAVAAPDAGDGPVDALAAHSPPTPWLIVVDNLEQAVGGAAALAVLLEAVPSLTILATSREPLHLRAEHLVLVDGLSRSA